MKSSEQLEQQALELSKSPQNKEGVAGQEQLAVEQEELAQQLEVKKKMALQDAELGVVDLQKSVVLEKSDQEFVWVEKKLKHEVINSHNLPESVHPDHETATVIAKPLGSVYAWLSEAKIAARVEAGKIEAANNVSESLIPQAGDLFGSIIDWLNRRAA